MTYDEWKKARAEAAVKYWGGRNLLPSSRDESLEQQLAKAIEAIDAVPLPSEKELDEIVCMAMWGDLSPPWSEMTECMQIPVRTEAKAVIEALRPWLATMIEKGKGVCSE